MKNVIKTMWLGISMIIALAFLSCQLEPEQNKNTIPDGDGGTTPIPPDQTTPTATINLINNMATNVFKIDIDGTYSENGGVLSEIRLVVNTTTNIVPSVSNGVWSNTNTTLGEGTNTIYAIAVGTNGYSSNTVKVKYIADTTAPVISNYATNGQYYSISPTISGYVNDVNGSGVRTVYLSIDNPYLFNPVAFSANSWTTNVTTTFTVGVHTNYVYAVDEVGNTSQIKTNIFNVSEDTPSIVLDSFTDGLTKNITIQIFGLISIYAFYSINKVEMVLNDITNDITSSYSYYSNPNLMLWGGYSLIEGTNSIIIIATSSTGKKAATPTIYRILDTTPPAIFGINPANGENVSGTNILSGYVYDAYSRTFYVKIDCGSWIYIYPSSNNVTNQWSTNISYTYGKHTNIISAQDYLGNQSVVTNIVERKAVPTVAIGVFYNNQIIRALITNISGTVKIDTPYTVSAMRYNVNGGSDVEIPYVSVGVSSPWSATNVTLTEGTNVITVTAVADNGMESNASSTLVVDTIAPVITVTNSIPLYSNLWSIGIYTSIVENGSGLNFLYFQYTNDTWGWSSFTGDRSFVLNSLATGTNKVRLWANDVAGNTSLTQTVTFIIDRDAPTVTIDNLTNNATFYTNGTFQIIGSASDQYSGIENTYLSLDGGAYIPLGNGTKWTNTLNMGDGKHTVSVIAKDLAGNTSSPLTLDNINVIKDGIYVDAYFGNAVNSGGAGLPLKNIQTAINKAVELGITNVYIGNWAYFDTVGQHFMDPTSNPYNADILITNNNIHLIGGWEYNTIGYTERSKIDGRASTPRGHILTIAGCSNILIENIEFDRGQQEVGGSVYITNARNVLVNNIAVEALPYSAMGPTLAGGGIYIKHSTNVTISNSIISNCVSTVGGGVCYETSSGKIINSWIGNNGGVQGGGIAVSNSVVEIKSNIIVNNQTMGYGVVPSQSYGGGVAFMYCSLPSEVSGNIITNNNATNTYGAWIDSPTGGGGLSYYYGAVGPIFDNVIAYNKANGSGAGINLYWNASFSVGIYRNQIISNTAIGGGGGMLLNRNSVSATINSNVISYNEACWGGGIMLSLANTGTVLVGNNVNCNTASSNGGGFGTYYSGVSILGGSVTNNTKYGIGDLMLLGSYPAIDASVVMIGNTPGNTNW